MPGGNGAEGGAVVAAAFWAGAGVAGLVCETSCACRATKIKVKAIPAANRTSKETVRNILDDICELISPECVSILARAELLVAKPMVVERLG